MLTELAWGIEWFLKHIHIRNDTLVCCVIQIKVILLTGYFVYKPGRRLRKPGMNHQAARMQPITPPTISVIISTKCTTLWSVKMFFDKLCFQNLTRERRILLTVLVLVADLLATGALAACVIQQSRRQNFKHIELPSPSERFWPLLCNWIEWCFYLLHKYLNISVFCEVINW